MRVRQVDKCAILEQHACALNVPVTAGIQQCRVAIFVARGEDQTRRRCLQQLVNACDAVVTSCEHEAGAAILLAVADALSVAGVVEPVPHAPRAPVATREVGRLVRRRGQGAEDRLNAGTGRDGRRPFVTPEQRNLPKAGARLEGRHHDARDAFVIVRQRTAVVPDQKTIDARRAKSFDATYVDVVGSK